MCRLFENDDVLAVDKPPGLSMATSTRRDKAPQAVVERLLEACRIAPDSRVRLVHRLDVGTSGVVLLAKSEAAHRSLSQAFQTGGVRKTYRALVWGNPVPVRGAWTEPLTRDPKDGRKMRTARAGKRAVTRYETQRRLRSWAELRLYPETGRTHQIRVHASAHGHPIVGDDLYGGATRWHGVREPTLRRALSAVTRPLLHAERLEIPALTLDVSTPPPEDYESLLRILYEPKNAPMKR